MNAALENSDLLLTRGWIDGKEIDSDQQFAVVNPATLTEVANVSDLGAAHARAAIGAATAAFAEWKTAPMADRVNAILKWADLIEQNAEDLCQIICLENGKPLGQARGEALQCASLLRWFAEQAGQLQGTTLPEQDSGQRNHTINQPIGVVA